MPTTRRRFLGAATLAALGTSLPGAPRLLAGPAEDEPLNLTFSGYPLDRVAGLISGDVEVAGCEVTYEPDKIGGMNTHVFSGPQTRDFTEIGLHPFMLAYANDGFRDYSLLPVFPLRTFRHKSVFIRTDRGIDTPQDLKGKKVATPGFSSTSLTWLRGIFEEEYGVRPSDIEWYVSDLDSSAAESGGASKWENLMPRGLTVHDGPAGKDESDMLEDGDIDALFHAVEPRCFIEGHPKVARLFADTRAEEQAYFRKTGIFPIMHAVAMRNATIEANPWLPAALFEAYAEAKALALRDLETKGWFSISLPWIAQELESTQELMGTNFWPYGIEPNRKALDTLFRYSHEQGLATKRISVEEMFHPATLDFAEK